MKTCTPSKQIHILISFLIKWKDNNKGEICKLAPYCNIISDLISAIKVIQSANWTNSDRGFKWWYKWCTVGGRAGYKAFHTDTDALNQITRVWILNCTGQYRCRDRFFGCNHIRWQGQYGSLYKWCSRDCREFHEWLASTTGRAPVVDNMYQRGS